MGKAANLYEDAASMLTVQSCVRVQVNYVGKAANLYEDAGYELSGAAYVINKHLGATWLWDRVRVSGGAYGGFCDFDPHSGMFSFLSYRDPNLLKTARPGGVHLCKWAFEYVAVCVTLPSAQCAAPAGARAPAIPLHMQPCL